MVVLLPLLDGEDLRRCSRCDAIGLRSPVRERSSFYPRSRVEKGKYEAHCKRCSKRASTRYQQETKAYRVYRARRMEKIAQDPELLAAHQERQREYNRRYRERHPDRVRRSRRLINERRRIDEAIERGDEVQTQRAKNAGPKLPIGPFREWIEAQIETEARWARSRSEPQPEDKAKTIVAGRIGVTSRTLYRYRNELTEVYESVVDAALSRDGRYHLYDLYPHLIDDPGPAQLELAA